MDHDQTKTDDEITKFIMETKSGMDSGALTMEAGLDVICAFIEPLSAESMLRWIQLLVEVYKTPGTKPRKEGEHYAEDDDRAKLQKLNVALNGRKVFCDAISRYHVWKNEQPTTPAAQQYVARLIDRLNRVGSMVQLENVIRDGRAQYNKWKGTPTAETAFREAFMSYEDSIVDVEHRRDYYKLLKKYVLGEKDLSTIGSMVNTLTTELRDMAKP